MRHRLALVSLAIVAAGCQESTFDGGSSVTDLFVDGAASSEDGGVVGAPDAAAPLVDQAPSNDLVVVQQDLTNDDLTNCASGFISDGVCPLSCSSLVAAVVPEPAVHIPYPMKGSWQTNPPSSGSHWGDPQYAPAPWGKHDVPVPREAWIHNLEHGGVVMLYNCPPPNSGPYVDGGTLDDCSSTVAALKALHDNYPLESWHDMFEGIKERRILITADPELPNKVAILAWGWVMVSDTVEYNAFDCFLHARYGHGPENFP